MTIDFLPQALADLTARAEREGLNASTITNRAVQVYRFLADAQDRGATIIVRVGGLDNTLEIKP